MCREQPIGETPMIERQTARLRLLALSQDHLALCLDDPSALERALSLPLARAVITDVVRRAIRIKLTKMAVIPAADHAWFTYWLIVIREPEPVGAGLIGFKGTPQRTGTYDQPGEVEIGYGIAPERQGHGYTTEAVRAMIAWAFEHPGCRAVIAPHTLKTNPASNRVLEKVGMRVYDETPDTLSWRLDRDK